MPVVHMGDCPVTWSTSIYSIRSGSQVYGSFLEEFPTSHKDTVDDENCFLSPNRRSIGEAIQTLEDMLRACVLDLKGSWEEHLPLVKFANNNSYQVSIRMAPYEALYGRPCQSPVCWTEVRKRPTMGPDLVRNTCNTPKYTLTFL